MDDKVKEALKYAKLEVTYHLEEIRLHDTIPVFSCRISCQHLETLISAAENADRLAVALKRMCDMYDINETCEKSYMEAQYALKEWGGV